MKTICASFSNSWIWSEDSCAAKRPASGLAPQPRPEVRDVPICSLLSVSVVERCCASVLRARKSTPVIWELFWGGKEGERRDQRPFRTEWGKGEKTRIEMKKCNLDSPF